MSRIGRQPIAIPSGVEVAFDQEQTVTVKGPKGTLSRRLHPDVRIVVDGAQVRVERPSDEAFAALTPSDAPRMTMAVLMNHSERAAGRSQAARCGNRFPTRRPETNANR